MPIPVACPCGARLKVPDGSAGKKVKCPKCGALIPVEAAEEAPPAPAEKACPFCAEKIPAASKVCPFCSSGLDRRSPAPRARAGDDARDLSMEGHLRAIALWYRIGGVLCAVFGLLFVVAAGGSMRVGPAEIGCVIAVLIVLGGLSYVLGHFLWKYANWARVTAGVFTIIGIILNVLSLFVAMAAPRGPGGAEAAGNFVGVLVGSGWSALYLWAFFNRRSAAICTPEYQALIGRTLNQKCRPYASFFFWVPMIFVGLAVLIGVAGAIMATI